ncbi:MAG: aldo/keto reductase, partial [Candidatus Eremiobacteraeota bacterium]|nr:aldo/keto reductase [Candidatus Eremiobacteraeota bacterium]
MEFSRREFLLISALGLAGLNVIRAEALSQIPKRPLGNTGLDISILGFGNALGYQKSFPAESVRLFRSAIKNGINFFDIEPEEGMDEQFGRLSIEERKGIISSSKSFKRTAKELEKDVLLSLKRLRLKCLDILFLHALDKPVDLEIVCGPGGAGEGLKHLRKNNIVRFFGASGHKYDVLLAAAKRIPLDVVFCPVNLHCVDEFEDKYLPEFRRLGVGILAMKVFDGGKLLKSFFFRNFIGLSRMMRYVWD